jgi:hypothetical protein
MSSVVTGGGELDLTSGTGVTDKGETAVALEEEVITLGAAPNRLQPKITQITVLNRITFNSLPIRPHSWSKVNLLPII